MVLIGMALLLLMMKLNKVVLNDLPGILSSSQKAALDEELHGLPPISGIDIENSFIRHFMVAKMHIHSTE